MEMTTEPKPRSAAAGSELESLIQQKGQAIFSSLEEDSGSVFNKDWWYGRIMDWSMKNEHFKTQMFRFVDVLPSLHSGSDVARHLKEYFSDSGDNLPSVFNFGLGLGGLAPGLLAGTVKKNVEQMARMFITGATVQEALPQLRKSRGQNMCFTVDLLGEATLSEKEALEYQARYLELIEQLSEEAKTWTHNPQIDQDAEGPIPKVNVSVKVTSLYSQVDPMAWDKTLETLKNRLRPILSLAVKHNVFINLDMEQYAYKDLTLQLFKDLLSEPECKSYPHFGVVIQAYLRESVEDVNQIVKFAKQRATPLTVRLVKGAYWDYEVIHARQMDWPIPVFLNKKESDVSFEQCSRVLLQNYPHVKLALGSHNVRSIAAAVAFAESLRLPSSALEVQMLYGMAEPIKKAVVKMNYRLREYATIGELIPGMAYLVRRLLENTSNESFLRAKFSEHMDSEKLLEPPSKSLNPSSGVPVKDPSSFYNQALLDFSKSENRMALVTALREFRRTLGRTIGPQISGQELKTSKTIERRNPSNDSEVVARVSVASPGEADAAIASALKAAKAWRVTEFNERANIIERLGEKILENRFRLMAIEILEVGKTWAEADGDITEAVDFCKYYAREMRRLGEFKKTASLPGEMSVYGYRPKGIAAVIAPWNFPLAILTGMASAALVTGNTVIMKPAEQSSVIAYELYKLMMEAGVPAGAVHCLPGLGEDVGAYLTQHPAIDLIAFTGSREVGLKILNSASQVQAGQRGLKKCIIEMGGKNAIIVDSDADLDEAVDGVVYSAFGFQGQKCSACSRVIVHELIYERFVERLVEATKSICVASAENPESYLGPVVDKESFDRIRATIEKGMAQAKLLFKAEVPTTGYFVPPTIFAVSDANSPLVQEEIFGPVLCCLKAKDLDHAFEIANGVQYGLTGGIYTRSPAAIEKAKQEFDVGNLYINRGITGAMVGRHPFGGHKMSGIGSKTGGPDYLLQFMDPITITENTLRRGFAPES